MMIKGSPRTIAMQEMETNQLGWSGVMEGSKDAPSRVTERINKVSDHLERRFPVLLESMEMN